ncbi:hypothetical protein LCGC14_2243890 [marine sediment metagenome]|uniref:Uncharacterized protein n=1 Tax=marine sediment metagenome TaxID=412755 RepID=A0A0F9FH49_9ZZZZ
MPGKFKLQLKTKQGWKDAHYDFPHNKKPMTFEKKGDAITARMKKFGIGSKHYTRVVTPQGRKFLM